MNSNFDDIPVAEIVNPVASSEPTKQFGNRGCLIAGISIFGVLILLVTVGLVIAVNRWNDRADEVVVMSSKVKTAIVDPDRVARAQKLPQERSSYLERISELPSVKLADSEVDEETLNSIREFVLNQCSSFETGEDQYGEHLIDFELLLNEVAARSREIQKDPSSHTAGQVMLSASRPEPVQWGEILQVQCIHDEEYQVDIYSSSLELGMVSTWWLVEDGDSFLVYDWVTSDNGVRESAELAQRYDCQSQITLQFNRYIEKHNRYVEALSNPGISEEVRLSYLAALDPFMGPGTLRDKYLFFSAYFYYQEGLPENALRVLEKVSHQCPGKYLLENAIASDQEDYQKASESLDQYVRLIGKFRPLLITDAEYQNELGRLDEAKDRYIEAFAEIPDQQYYPDLWELFQLCDQSELKLLLGRIDESTSRDAVFNYICQMMYDEVYSKTVGETLRKHFEANDDLQAFSAYARLRETMDPDDAIQVVRWMDGIEDESYRSMVQYDFWYNVVDRDFSDEVFSASKKKAEHFDQLFDLFNYEELEITESVLKIVNEYQSLAPDDARTHQLLGDWSASKYKLEDAEKHYREALKVGFPDSENDYSPEYNVAYRLISILTRLKKWDEMQMVAVEHDLVSYGVGQLIADEQYGLAKELMKQDQSTEFSSQSNELKIKFQTSNDRLVTINEVAKRFAADTDYTREAWVSVLVDMCEEQGDLVLAVEETLDESVIRAVAMKLRYSDDKKQLEKFDRIVRSEYPWLANTFQTRRLIREGKHREASSQGAALIPLADQISSYDYGLFNDLVRSSIMAKNYAMAERYLQAIPDDTEAEILLLLAKEDNARAKQRMQELQSYRRRMLIVDPLANELSIDKVLGDQTQTLQSYWNHRWIKFLTNDAQWDKSKIGQVIQESIGQSIELKPLDLGDRTLFVGSVDQNRVAVSVSQVASDSVLGLTDDLASNDQFALIEMCIVRGTTTSEAEVDRWKSEFIQRMTAGADPSHRVHYLSLNYFWMSADEYRSIANESAIRMAELAAGSGPYLPSKISLEPSETNQSNLEVRTALNPFVDVPTKQLPNIHVICNEPIFGFEELTLKVDRVSRERQTGWAIVEGTLAEDSKSNPRLKKGNRYQLDDYEINSVKVD
ncbi:MAG: hypothetical protein AAFN77_22295 [Planctomycetota bacterium]